jgi:DNA-binding NtrC family response regulator
MTVKPVSHIMVVDDEDQVGAAIRIALHRHGHSAEVFDSGQAALRELDKSEFDLAIVDVFMMQMDGMTLINEIRKRLPRLPIVVISGGEFGGVALEFIGEKPDLSGIVRLQKPFRPQALIAAMQEAEKNAAMQKWSV